MVSIPLRHFSPDEIYISRHEAWTILKFFYSSMALTESQLTGEDIGFAQALLVQAIDSSYAVGYVQGIFDSFFMKVPGSFIDIREMIKEFVKKAAKNWFKHLGAKSLSDATIYEIVRVDIAQYAVPTIQTREQTGELIY
jgi:hypothetical protein